jgi:nitrogen fixation-related uncharacterized protein
MTGKGREAAQRLLAIIVIISMLGMMGIPPTVIVFFAVVTYFIWRAVQRSEYEDTARIFKFYIAANDILRDEDKRWYGFEIEEIIERGERAVHSMIDPPPLACFTLGALQHRAGNYEAAIDQLTDVVENEAFDERYRRAPSPELRRYVHILRKLEREPAEAPQTMAAIRSLDRARRNRAASILAESRERVNAVAVAARSSAQLPKPVSDQVSLFTESAKSVASSNASAPPQQHQNMPARAPISEVLHDLYEEKKTA